MLYFDRQLKLYPWNRTDYSYFCGKCITFYALFAALLPTIQKWCSTAFALKCARMKEKYRYSCRWRHFPTITVVYVSHGLWMRQSYPKMHNKHFHPKWLTLAFCIAQELNPGQLLVSQQHCTTDDITLHSKVVSTVMWQAHINTSKMCHDNCLP